MTLYFLLLFLLSAITIETFLRCGWAHRLAMDMPNERSLHVAPIPRAGGILVLPWALLYAGTFPELRWVCVAAGILMLVSFADDRLGLRVGTRLGTHLLVSAITLWSMDPPLWALLPLVLCLTWGLNLFNFMDGADGLAGGMALIGFGAYALAAHAAGNVPLFAFAGAIASAAGAFLAFNFPPARLFLGDAGSTTLGFLAAVLGYWGWQTHAWNIWFPVMVFSPFLVDASVTLLKRMLRREKVWQAHREHYYQRLVLMGWGRRKLVACAYVWMLVCTCSAFAVNSNDLILSVCGATLCSIGYTFGMRVIDRQWHSFKSNN